MPTWTDELGFWKIGSGEVYSSGSHASNWDQTDESIATYRLDASRAGVAGTGSCGVAIDADTQGVTVSAGTVWYNSEQYQPSQQTVDGDDGLTTGTDGDYRIYYDATDTGTPYYATTASAADPERDVHIGWVVVSAGSVTDARRVPLLGRNEDFLRLYAGTSSGHVERLYPLAYAPIRVTLASGEADVTLSRPYSGSGSYAVAVTPEGTGDGRLAVSYSSGSTFTIESSDATDARVVRCIVLGHEDW